MKKALGIILKVFIFVVGVGLVALFLQSSFTFRSCDKALTLDKKVVGCGGIEGSFPFEGALFVLPVDKITQEADETYLTLKYPLFWGLFSLPLKTRVGIIPSSILSEARGGKPNIAVCRSRGEQFCRYIFSNDLLTLIRPGTIVAVKLHSQISLTDNDPYFIRCQNVQKDFISRVKDRKSLLPYLNSNALCVPVVGQITYQ